MSYNIGRWFSLRKAVVSKTLCPANERMDLTVDEINSDTVVSRKFIYGHIYINFKFWWDSLRVVSNVLTNLVFQLVSVSPRY